jgi:O-acetyl-ADP-ribose deacetylase (regulator of RNase III)
MTSKIDLRFQVLQTEIKVIYSNIIQLEADVVVSADDVLLSMGGGIARAIRAAASGESHNAALDDVRKHSLPIPIGSVLVTSAGQLRAKHIFHAVAIDFDMQPKPKPLLAHIVRRVMELATSLQARSLAVPLLGTGLIGLPENEALDFILRSLACYLISESSNLQQITITLYKDKANDQTAAENDLYEALTTLRDQVAQWAKLIAPFNKRMGLLRALHETLAEEPELAEDMTVNVQPLTLRRYEVGHQRLNQKLNELSNEAKKIKESMVKLKRIQNTYERRLQSVGNAEASQWQDKLNRVIQDLRKYEKQLTDNNEHQNTLRREEETLSRAWEQHASTEQVQSALATSADILPEGQEEGSSQTALILVDNPTSDKIDQLKAVVEVQLDADRRALSRLFGCRQTGSTITAPLNIGGRSQASLSSDELQRRIQRLRQKLADVDDEMTRNAQVIDEARKRKQDLELKSATMGGLTDYSTTRGIEEAQKMIDKHKAQQQQLEEEQKKTQQILDALQSG